MDRQTKIIATLGPASYSQDRVSDLVGAGMDVARLNFSHGDHAQHALVAEWIRRASEIHQKPIAVLQDIQGPKIRVGGLPNGAAEFRRGQRVELLPGTELAGEGQVTIDYPHLLEDIQVGEPVVLSDGLLRFEVLEQRDDRLVARVLLGGLLRSNKGVAFPDTNLRVPAVTEKDKIDLEFGRELGVDYVAASFVRTSADIKQVKELAGTDVPVIAKVELSVAYTNLDDILSVADGVMVARGDLGVELPLERLPFVQQDILERTNAAGRVSITATEMLESMTSSPRPTRAEVTDVATAVQSGTDAVMLSAETAIGDYPVRTIEMMDSICREAEQRVVSSRINHQEVDFLTSHRTFASATAKAAVEAAWNLDLKTIVAFTESGRTALLLSKYRPAARIMAFAAEESIMRRMAMYWGVQASVLTRRDHTDRMIAAAEKFLEKQGICERGDGVVMVAGVPPNQQASTNLMKLHTIGERMKSAPHAF